MARSKRKRDYHAEYERRVRNAEAKGKTRQQARGHGNVPQGREYAERAARTRRKYGAAPARLSSLRSAAVNAIYDRLEAAGTKKWINRATIRAGLLMLHRETLEIIIAMDIEQFKLWSGAGPVGEGLLDYGTIREAFPYENPEGYEELGDGTQRNPFWYH